MPSRTFNPIIKVIMHGIHRIHVTMIYSWSHSQTGILWPGYGTLDSKELPELHDTSCFMYTLWESHRFELSKLPVFHDFSIFVGWTDRQAGWQTDRQTDRQTDALISELCFTYRVASSQFYRYLVTHDHMSSHAVYILVYSHNNYIVKLE